MNRAVLNWKLVKGHSIVFLAASAKIFSGEKLKTFYYLAHSLLSSIAGGEGDKCVASIEACHGIHHESEVPNGAAFFKQRYQITLIHVLGNFATKYLQKFAITSKFQSKIVKNTYFTACRGTVPLPFWWRTSIFSLSCGDVKFVSGSVQYFFDFVLIRAFWDETGPVDGGGSIAHIGRI